MIPHRHLQRNNQHQQFTQNDRVPLQNERDFFQASGGLVGGHAHGHGVHGGHAQHGASNGGGLGGLNMNMQNLQNLPNLQAALNNGIGGNDELSQQLRLYQANQELMLAAARRDQDGLSFARQTLTQHPHQGLHHQNNVPPQALLNHHFGGLQGMGGLKSNNNSFQSENILSEAYQRGKEEVLRSLLQARNGDGNLDGGGMGNLPAQFHQMQQPSNNNMGQQQLQNQPQQDKLSSLIRKDPNSQALEALGTTSIERRKKNSPYFDASALVDPDPVALANRRTRGGVTEPFPEKLHRMLREVEKNQQSDIIGFLGHGRAFAIHDPDRFCKEVMPNYFKQSRLSSFQRQLNLYGFTRITNGSDAGGYYHELFLRGRAALAIHMRRVGVTSATSNHRSIRPTGNTPDFYNMIPVQGAPELEKNDATARSA